MSFHLYPVTPTGLSCKDYTLTVNGIPAPTDTARVSRVPFNRRWPGHQRSIDQTELVNFLSLASDEPLTFEITLPEPADSVVIRPAALGITPTLADRVVTFTLDHPASFTVEPYGRNRALHIFCDPMPSYAVDPADPNVIYYGPGEHDVGQIDLQSGQTLFLDEGAVVYACVSATDAENIRILGRGILDNSRNQEHILFPVSAEGNDSAINNATRQHTLQLEYCNHVEIDGITIRDSLVYNIRPMACQDLHIANVKIIGCWRYNSDGIDMHNCRDVLIENCFLRTFDDSVCVKGFDCYYEGDVEAAVKAAMYRNGKAYDVFRDTLVRNCVIWNDWGKCLEIGAKTRAEEICNIRFEDCHIIHVTGTPLDCYNIDYADVHHVSWKNCTIELDDTIPNPQIQNRDSEEYEITDPNYCPSLIAVQTAYHHEYSAGGTRRGQCRELLFQNIRVTGRYAPHLTFEGYDETHLTQNILVESIVVNGIELDTLPEGAIRQNAFTRNITYRTAYHQLAQNTVSASRQLAETDLVKFENPDGTGPRVMFVGNSITLHGIKPDIGWHGSWGMAASEKEKDYVHRLMAKVRAKAPNAAFAICQVASWERQYKEGSITHHLFAEARRFGADLIVMRFIENCPGADFDDAAFGRELGLLLDYLNPTGKAKFVLSTGFWRHPGDKAITDFAKIHGLPLVPLGDLGEDPAMKAIGLFDHTGVANHPGDRGMEAIAERLWHEMEPLL